MSYSAPAATLTIDQQHEAIDACCGELLALLRAGTDLAGVGQLRMRLAGLLHANLAREEVEIDRPMRRLSVQDRPASFTDAADEAAELRRRYSQHVGRWSLAMIASDQRGYSADVAELTRALRAHLRAKRDALPVWRWVLAA